MIVRAQVRVRLTRAHVDATGFITRSGEQHVWRSIAGLPNGARVVLDLGPAGHPSQRLFDICRDLGPDTELILEGGSASVAEEFIQAAREVSR